MHSAYLHVYYNYSSYIVIIGMHELYEQMHPNYNNFVGCCRPDHPGHPVITSVTSLQSFGCQATANKLHHMYVVVTP